ncbi:MAG TPA: hypothetical protein ENK18_15670 [Deltaproteobacteria bacterium]|nr:hypothetical protein [Deltaproteobacteria bacterium]
MSPRRTTPGRPTRREAAQQLRARRQQLRQELRQQLQRHRASSPRPSRRRRWWLLLLPLVLLAALLRDCSCSPPPEPIPAPIPTLSAPVRLAPPSPSPPPPPLPEAHIERRDRPSFETEPSDPLPWIASFRSQVAARSPRLAACFVGAQRPGRLRWTASVEPSLGRVSEHTLEPTLLSEALTKAQRACVIDVLSEPPYRLTVETARATPPRIGLVIEF